MGGPRLPVFTSLCVCVGVCGCVGVCWDAPDGPFERGLKEYETSVCLQEVFGHCGSGGFPTTAQPVCLCLKIKVIH